jgi:dTDP-glucose 4,6-dehydratase
MKILVTGGAGFIGSNFIRYLLAQHDDHVINLDKLTYAGNLENLAELEKNRRYRFVKGDICDPDLVDEVAEGVDGVINFAAETHVDRSIISAADFVRTDVVGTHVLLEAVRRRGVPRYLQISTDEVYGSIESGGFDEAASLSPNSPYAASKAGGDLLVRAYFVTHRLPVLISRSSNNYGPYQYPEKLIPLFITNALEDKPLPLYGDGLNVRDWIYVEDNCRAIDLAFRKGSEGEVYNIGGGEERTNRSVAEAILHALGKPVELIRPVADRPGHDRRYALKTEKIRALGFAPRVPLDQGLPKTVEWYREHRTWWERIRSGEFQKYYQSVYKTM